MKNAGTPEGTAEEVKFVQFLNKRKAGNIIWNALSDTLGIKKLTDCYAIRVTTKQTSRLIGKKVPAKADVYIAQGSIPEKYLEERNFFLDEEDVESFSLRKLCHSGISVKRHDSERYQILKMTPVAFFNLFESYELGAGASVFCEREDELQKNDSVVTGWKTDWERIFRYFENCIPEIRLINDGSRPSYLRMQIAKKLKEYSNSAIKNKITSSEKLLDFVFKGIGNFDEPYTATWLYERGEFRKNRPSDFTVTTGSGRSRGDFTIVIKP